MEFRWKQFFELIESAFEISKSDIALYLDVHKSTITRLSKGETSNFSRSKVIYDRLFNLDASKSLVCKQGYKNQKESKNSLLETFKEIIKDRHWVDSTKEIESNNYEDYVKGLICLAISNSTKQREKKEKILSDARENPLTDAIKNQKRGTSDLSETMPLPLNDLTIVDKCPEISIPPQYRKCLYCEYFAIARTVHKFVANVLGTCTLYSRKTSSIQSACDDFQANESKITQEMLIGTFPFHDKFHF